MLSLFAHTISLFFDTKWRIQFNQPDFEFLLNMFSNNNEIMSLPRQFQIVLELYLTNLTGLSIYLNKRYIFFSVGCIGHLQMSIINFDKC